MLKNSVFHLAIWLLLQCLCVSSEWTDSKWDPSDSGVDLLFDLEVATSMLFVDGDGPSDQFFIDVDTGRIHAESLQVFQHPQMLLHTAVRNDLYNKGYGAWVPILNSQILNIHDNSLSPKNYQLCWHSTNATTQLLQRGGVHRDQVAEASSIGCFHLSLDFKTLFGDVFQPMPRRECWQKYAPRDICNTHTITTWSLAPIVDDVAAVPPPQHEGSSFIRLHLGSIYRIKFKITFEIMQDDASFLIVEKETASLVVFRNKINFVYLVQNDGFCNVSHLRHTDAEVLVVQWKEEHDCEGCFFFPDSTVNEGRNELWYRTFEKWPGTVFTYYIFLDGDVSLILRTGRNKLSLQPNASSESLPFRVFEQHLLHYRPAVAVPFHGWHVDNGSDVQFVSNFDHIVIAVHAAVSRMFLPTETRFDHKSWWWAQRVWGLLGAVAFPQQMLQINAVMSDNGSLKYRSVSTADESPYIRADCCNRRVALIISSGTKHRNQSAAVGTKKYMRDARFEHVFVWFMASLKKDLASILPDFQTNLSQPQPSSRVMQQAAQTDGMFWMAVLTEFTKTFDYSHPYWLNHRFLLVTNKTFTGFLSPCIYFVDVGETSRDSCEKNDADWHVPSRIEVETLMLVMNLNQLVLEQNQAIMRLTNAFEKRSEQ
jgi:hypothetical protein